ncbi:MAG: hypothetical protein HYY84_01000 [Deltaproteobacteria bacterium]|nr:hypothetical protein [Deltaproteobacteria bacterium]
MHALHRALVITVAFLLGALVLVTILQTLDRADVPAVTTGIATTIAVYLAFTPLPRRHRLVAPALALVTMFVSLLYFFSAFWRSSWTLSLALVWGAAYLFGFGVGRTSEPSHDEKDAS